MKRRVISFAPSTLNIDGTASGSIDYVVAGGILAGNSGISFLPNTSVNYSPEAQDQTLNVIGQSLAVIGDAGDVGADLTVNVGGNGAVRFLTSQHLSS